jgi:hypothetical protein
MKTYGVDVYIHVLLTSALVIGVVSFTLRQLYPQRKSPQYPLDRRLGRPQNRFGRREEEKILDPTENRTQTPR